MEEAFSIHPKTDCPHIQDNYLISPEGIRNAAISNSCVKCKDSKENWGCLNCGFVYCSRYINGHCKEHFNEEKHCIALSFSDLSIWCYSCNSYITSYLLYPVLNESHLLKFGHPMEVPDSWKEFIFTLERKNDNVTEEDSSVGDTHIFSDVIPNTKEDSEDISEEILDISSIVEKNDTNNNIPDTDSILPDGLNGLVSQLMSVLSISSPPLVPKEKRVLAECTLNCVIDGIKAGKFKKIIVMSGAGVSCAAGIPDFRSPGTGLYDNLQKYNLPYPTAIFELPFFLENPKPFYHLAKEIYPGNYKPTHCHYFINLLAKKGVLLRNFTQNIDTLEREAGVSGEYLVEAHGSFAKAHCTKCSADCGIDRVKEHVFAEKIPYCEECSGGVVKPDIVFFGEGLPTRFFDQMIKDFPVADLLIVMGTSLKVQPFAGLIHRVNESVPRVLINMEEVATGPDGFLFNERHNYRDVKALGDCQDIVIDMVKKLGWMNEFEELMNSQSDK